MQNDYVTSADSGSTASASKTSPRFPRSSHRWMRARIHDRTHESKCRDVMSYEDSQSGDRNAIALFVHLHDVYNNFDFSGPLEFVKHAAGLSDRLKSGAAWKIEEKVA